MEKCVAIGGIYYKHNTTTISTTTATLPILPIIYYVWRMLILCFESIHSKFWTVLKLIHVLMQISTNPVLDSCWKKSITSCCETSFLTMRSFSIGCSWVYKQIHWRSDSWQETIQHLCTACANIRQWVMDMEKSLTSAKTDGWKKFTNQLQRQDQKQWGQTQNATNISEQPSTKKMIKVASTCGTYEGRKSHQKSLSVAAKWKRSRGRPSKRWTDCVEEDLGRASVTKFRKTPGRQ